MSFSIPNWPPGFRSSLLDPKSPNSILPGHAASFTSRRATEARDQAAREGKGWAGGSLESLAKERFIPGEVPTLNAKPFRFKAGSVAERIYVFLRDSGPADANAIGKAVHVKQHEVRPSVTPAIRAGVILARRIEAGRVIFEVGNVVEEAA